MRDPYLYDDVDVLKNKLNIKDEKELDEIERDITVVRLADIEKVSGNFDFEHLKKIHKHIFGDIYDWAGKEREIDMRKSEEILGGPSVTYAYPTEIKELADAAFEKLNNTKWTELPVDDRAEQYAKNIAEIWQVHPFREGNTRTTIAFACEYANAHGFPMNKQLFAENPRFTRNALVMASIGKYSEFQHLTQIFKDSMEQANDIEPIVSDDRLNINLTTKGEIIMSNNYEMDSIGSSTVLNADPHRMSVYDTIGVVDENAIAFLENQRQAVELNTQANNLRKNATTKSGGWNDRQLYEHQKVAANEYSQKAAEALEKIDVNAISKDDYMQVLSAQTDNKRGTSLDDDIKAKITCRYIAAHADDKQLTAMIDGCSKKAREELIQQAKEKFADLVPPDEELNKQVAEIKGMIADGEPRPDIKNPDAINKYVLDTSNKICDVHLAEEAKRLETFKNTPAPTTARYQNTGLPDITAPGSGDYQLN